MWFVTHTLWQEGWARCATWRISSFQNYHHTHITVSSIPPLFWCNYCIASSFFALPIVLQRKKGQDLSIPVIGRTVLEPSLLKRDVVAIVRFQDACWSHWSCPHGKNCLRHKMIKHTSPCLASTAIPLMRFTRSTSQGWLLNLRTPGGKRERFSLWIAFGFC